jgi:hypothetical protein
MWKQMKKTFVFVQFLAVALAALIYYRSGNWSAAVAAVAFIELSNVLGLLWAQRLRRRMSENLTLLPPRR